jgi:hypothetical protein
MTFLPTEISKIIYENYVKARNDMIETSVISKIAEIIKMMYRGKIAKKKYVIEEVTINVLSLKKSQGMIYHSGGIYDGDYYDGRYELFIYRKCVIEINGDVFGLDFESGVGRYNELDDNHDHPWEFFLCSPSQNEYKRDMIMKAINLSVMTELDAKRTGKFGRESDYGTVRGIYELDNKISREKLAWIIGDSIETCRKRRACNFPSKFNFY